MQSTLIPFLALILALTQISNLPAQDKAKPAYPEKLFDAFKYRPIGPFRGGRSAACCGVPGKSTLFYFGAAGGGVWRTTDGAETWENISDGYFGGSIGAVAVSEWDNNVIYVGGGEMTVRGNVSHGDGVWKSTDAGKTWKHMGLDDTRHIPRIRIHPKNPDLVYVAAMGHLFGPNKQRGVFRSSDGGKTWKKILYVNEDVGAVDLIMDPNNPRILFASTWRIRRTPYSLDSGGEGCGLWKSTDGGDTWENITENKGMPKGLIGIIGIAISPVDSNRVWAIVENKDGGVFRSDDGGDTWKRINEDRNLRQRAWYFSRIYADPKNIDQVYVLNVRFWRSRDGGKTFQSIRTPHVDHHDLWIDPHTPERMIVADDGGGQVTYNGGKTWSTYHNQPTAQFYRVTTDNHFPYRIYGAQQDNSTVRILHRSSGGSIGEDDWEPTAGGESGHIAIKPTDPEIVYGGSYGGYLSRVNHRTKQVRRVDVWPDSPIGHGTAKLKERFQWNFPLFFSPHDPKTLYTASNKLFRSTDEGHSWQAISPDLTRDDKKRQQPSGGPITKDNTGVEYYCTIFAACESPLQKDILWAGSDDGLLHVSKNGGKTWEKVSPPGLPEWAQINSIEAHPTVKGGLYVAATCYKSDDFRPYLYKTTDYGKTWKSIVTGIAGDHFTRVVRADPGRPGLLYAGTEKGIYISFDDGDHWQPLQLNLPTVPITDLAIKNNDLVVATQGRSFWVLDDLTPLHSLKPATMAKTMHLFTPRPTHRISGGSTKNPPKTAGQNPPAGVVIFFYLKDKTSKKTLTLDILEDNGDLIQRFSVKPKDGEEKLTVKPGMNKFVWNMRYPGAEKFPGLVLWGGGLQGPKAMPGQYQARLSLGAESQTVPFPIFADPRTSARKADFRTQFDFLIEVRDKLSETHKAIANIKKIRKQIDEVTKGRNKDKKYKSLIKLGNAIKAELTKVEETLYQTKNKSEQDPLNYPIRLNNKLSALVGYVSRGDYPPTKQAIAVKEELASAIDRELAKYQQVIRDDVPRFNALVRELDVPAVNPD